MKRRSFIAAATAATAATAVIPATPALAIYGDLPLGGSVTIGVVGPFTGESLRAGEQIANGVRAATDDANRSRGSLDKAYLMRTFDDQNLLASGLVNAEFACDDANVVAVIGHLSGRITEGALQTYVTNRMPIICPASSYDRLTAHGYGNLIRLPTKDSIEGHLAARHINATIKPKAVAVLYQDGDYGADVAAGFQDQMLGDKVTSNAVAFAWDKPDFAGVAKATLEKAPELIYLAGVTKDMAPIVPKLRALGYTGPFFASQGFFDAATIAKLGPQAEGLTISCSMPPLALAPGAFRIKNDYERRYGPMSPIAAFSYAATQIVLAVVKRTGASDRIAVQRGLGFSNSFDTIIGPLSFANDGDPQNPNAFFYTVKDGAWRYVTAANPSSFIVK